jgi:hypothetical protein
MTQVFWNFPLLEVRETRKQKRKPGQRTYPHKYDHWQMLQDRIAGMTWAQVEHKHGIPKISGTPGRAARKLAMSSRATWKLQPHEVALLLRGAF